MDPVSELAPLVVGEVLVPTSTPAGPTVARAAWARSLGDYVLIVEGEDRLGRVGCLNPRSQVPDRTLACDLLEHYERA